MHSQIEQIKQPVNRGIDRNSADYRLGVCEADRNKMLKFIERVATALYSSDFTEPLGQYRTELYYREARAIIDQSKI